MDYGYRTPDLARYFGVSNDTIEGWMKVHEEFNVAVRDGKDHFDSLRVESALLRRAMGYDYEERRVENIVLKQGRGKNKVRQPAQRISVTLKHAQADITACIYWLQNRRPDRWKDQRKVVEQMFKGKVEFQHNHNHEVDLSKLGVRELERLRNTLAKAVEGTEDQAPRLTRRMAGRGFAAALGRRGNGASIPRPPLVHPSSLADR